MAETETVSPKLDQAVSSAITEHSLEQAPPQSTEVREPDVDDTETAAPPSQEAEATAGTEEVAEDQLLTQEEYDEVKDDPEALRKSLNRAFTKKTQDLAEQRRRLGQYQDFIDAYERDPRGTVSWLASQLGIAPAERTSQEVSQVSQEAAFDLAAELSSSLGEDFSFLGPKLAPALEKAITAGINRLAESKLKPVEQEQQAQRQRAAIAQTQALYSSMDARHPGWRKHSDAIADLAQKFLPARGQTDFNYLESLYFLATRDESSAASTRKVVERMKRSAARSEKPESAVSGEKVVKRPDKPVSFKEAYELAQQGKRLDLEDLR